MKKGKVFKYFNDDEYDDSDLQYDFSAVDLRGDSLSSLSDEDFADFAFENDSYGELPFDADAELVEEDFVLIDTDSEPKKANSSKKELLSDEHFVLEHPDDAPEFTEEFLDDSDDLFDDSDVSVEVSDTVEDDKAQVDSDKSSDKSSDDVDAGAVLSAATAVGVATATAATAAAGSKVVPKLRKSALQPLLVLNRSKHTFDASKKNKKSSAEDDKKDEDFDDFAENNIDGFDDADIECMTDGVSDSSASDTVPVEDGVTENDNTDSAAEDDDKKTDLDTPSDVAEDDSDDTDAEEGLVATDCDDNITAPDDEKDFVISGADDIDDDADDFDVVIKAATEDSSESIGAIIDDVDSETVGAVFADNEGVKRSIFIDDTEVDKEELQKILQGSDSIFDDETDAAEDIAEPKSVSVESDDDYEEDIHTESESEMAEPDDVCITDEPVTETVEVTEVETVEPEEERIAVAEQESITAVDNKLSEKKLARKKRKRKKKIKNVTKEVFSWIGLVVAAFAIAILVNLYVARPSVVSGRSMMPTLNDGDTIVISKIPYMLGEVEYGDIVVIDRQTNRERTFAVEFVESLKYNVLTQSLFDEQDLSEDIFWVKRIVGKPGDVIEFYQGKVYRNGELLTEDYILTQNVSSYPEGYQFIVKEGCVFVMGDNRNESMDSRMLALHDEQIEIDHIVGKLISK